MKADYFANCKLINIGAMIMHAEALISAHRRQRILLKLPVLLSRNRIEQVVDVFKVADRAR